MGSAMVIAMPPPREVPDTSRHISGRNGDAPAAAAADVVWHVLVGKNTTQAEATVEHMDSQYTTVPTVATASVSCALDGIVCHNSC